MKDPKAGICTESLATCNSPHNSDNLHFCLGSDFSYLGPNTTHLCTTPNLCAAPFPLYPPCPLYPSMSSVPLPIFFTFLALCPLPVLCTPFSLYPSTLSIAFPVLSYPSSLKNHSLSILCHGVFHWL